MCPIVNSDDCKRAVQTMVWVHHLVLGPMKNVPFVTTLSLRGPVCVAANALM